MLLISAFVRTRQTADRGSALIAVLGLMIVGLVLTTLVASSVVSAFGFSSSTRAGVESHAAADAGIAAARAGLYTAGDCAHQLVPGTYSASGSLAYTATIQFDAGSGWQSGCPTASASRIRIVSTGTPQAPGISGNTSGNTRQVEAIYNWLVPGIKPSGTAADFYGGATVEANSSFDFSESAGIVVQNGDLVCAKNNTTFNGNVFVNGNLDISKSCTVNGNATVSGLTTLGTINGNLTSGSVTPNPPSKTQVTGTYTQSSAPATTAPWVDVGYTPSDWIDPNTNQPYPVTVASGSGCNLTAGNLGDPTGKPIILNMLGCATGPVVANNPTVQLTSDVVIFANQFNFNNGMTFQSYNSAVHRLWFITPDNVADHAPTCGATQGPFSANNNLDVSQPVLTSNAIQAMLYTPCGMNVKNSFKWNGQLYVGSDVNHPTSINNNPTFTYSQVGIAGYDLSTGARLPQITTQQPGSMISNRDLAGN